MDTDTLLQRSLLRRLTLINLLLLRRLERRNDTCDLCVRAQSVPEIYAPHGLGCVPWHAYGIRRVRHKLVP